MQKAYSRINWQNTPSIDTPLGANNLNKMDMALDTVDNRVLTLYGYQDRASASEKNAKTSETNAKASETNAKQSELKAKEYMENAFAGTPEGYAELVEDVRLMDIQNTTDLTLANSCAGGYKLVSMSGASEQNGTPTVDSPIAIQNTFDCVEMMQGVYAGGTGAYNYVTYGVCSKNQIPCSVGEVVKVDCDNDEITSMAIMYYNNGSYVSYESVSSTSATFTIPSGVTHFHIRMSGAETTSITTDTVGKISLTINGKYVALFKNVGKNLVRFKDKTVNSNTGVTFTIKDSVAVCTGTPTITSGVVGTVFSEMIDLALLSDGVTYYPYKGCTIRVIYKDGTTDYLNNVTYDSETMRMIDVYFQPSVANYTSGMKYYLMLSDNPNAEFSPYKETLARVLLNEPLRDSDVLYKEDGLFKVQRNRGYVVFDGSSDEGWAIMNTTATDVYRVFVNNIPIKVAPTTASVEDILCTRYVATNATQNFLLTEGIAVTTSQTLYIYDGRYNTSDITLWTSYLADNPIEVEYDLATPTIEVLDTDSQIALNNLKTFDTVTHIIIDSRVKQKEIVSKYGTSEVGAITLKNELRNDTLEIKYNELAVALVATESGV